MLFHTVHYHFESRGVYVIFTHSLCHVAGCFGLSVYQLHKSFGFHALILFILLIFQIDYADRSKKVSLDK